MACACKHDHDHEHEHDHDHDGCRCGHDHDHGHEHGHDHGCGCCSHAPEVDPDAPWIVRNRTKILMAVSGIALACGLVLEHALGLEDIANVAYVTAAISGLVFVAPMAVSSIRSRSLDMNVLMGIAVLGGLIMGFMGDTSAFGDSALVIFLDQVGEWLEDWSGEKTKGSVRGLMSLVPDDAHVIGADGTVSSTPISEVEVGSVIRILPGERVPLDGTITSGASSFDEAAVTGESVPKDKTIGEDVYAGTLNAGGVVEVRVTADEKRSTLARVIDMVQGAEAEKAPYESFVDRFASIYTPVVIAAAAVAAFGVPLVITLVTGTFDGELWHSWIKRSLALLVVSCPCALVISTPVAFVSALSRAARDGILVKGGAHFDSGSRVTNVAFDKTGTLTCGEPSVTTIVPLAGLDDRQILAAAAALESASTHPLARAVVEHAASQGVTLPAATDVVEVAASGMSGVVEGLPCNVCKPATAREVATLDAAAEAAIEKVAGAGATALVVLLAKRAVGVIGVADTIRPTTPEVMAELAHMGRISSLEMLTGDNEHAAAAIAAKAGVTDVAANLLPDDKRARIAKLAESGRIVAMVGDGINDAPALAAANLGITMGAAASDTALEVADVALLAGDLSQLPAFFRLSARTMHIVRENVAFAIGVKVLVFVLVLMGMAGMSAAVFADTGVALIVILNGMRLMLKSRITW